MTKPKLTDKPKQTCPNCGYSGSDLVRMFDCARRKPICNYCVNQDAVGSDAINMIDKLAKHQADGTLHDYPVEQRLADLHGRKRETVQCGQ